MSLKSTSVLVVGVGGLGCPLATYLAAAGVGKSDNSIMHPRHTAVLCYYVLCSGVIGLLDYDAVEISNLHRQILHCEERVGTAKTDSAKRAITR